MAGLGPGRGGFYPAPTPLSPPLSTTSSLSQVNMTITRTATATIITGLPQARSSELKPGSAKESMIIDHIDTSLLNISGRFERRFDSKVDDGNGIGNGPAQKRRRPAQPAQSSSSPSPSVAAAAATTGYRNFEELAADLNRVLDVIWVTGTPNVQIPYLLNVPLTLADYLDAFHFSPKTLFPLLHKIDVATVSVLTGKNVESDESLPSHDHGHRTFTTTEKIRLSSVIESVRIAVTRLKEKKQTSSESLSAGPVSGTEESSNVDDTDTDMADDPWASDTEDTKNWDMQASRVYELTISEIGGTLGVLPDPALS